MFSKSCKYGLQAMLYIVLHAKEGKNIGLKEIAKDQEMPVHFLSKILQLLVKHKLISSTKGPNGGFYLLKSPRKITLLEIVKIIDGSDIFNQCGIGLKKCSDKAPCPIHNEYKIIKDDIKQILSKKSLVELCEDIDEGKSIVNFKKKQIKS
jgi:Rrf2 family transcriptional regulator, iron-sulfur cluster assembly transcription factor